MKTKADLPGKPKAPANRTARRLQGRLDQTVTAFGNLRVGQKLGLIAVTFGVPVVVLVTLVYRDQQRGVTLNRAEQSGLEVVRLITPLQESLHQRSLLLVKSKLEDQDAPQQLAELESVINEQVYRIQQAASRRPGLRLSEDVDNLLLGWRNLKEATPDLTLNTTIAYHRAFVDGAVRGLIKSASNSSSLTYDSNLSNYYLVTLSTRVLPNIRKRVAEIQQISEVAIREKSITEAGRETLTTLRAQMQEAQAEALDDFATAFAANPALEKSLSTDVQNLDTAITNFTEQINGIADGTDVVLITRSRFDPASLAASDVTFKLNSKLETVIKQQLQTRATALNTQRFVTLLGIAALLALAGLLLVSVSRAITRPLRGLASAAQALGQGDLTVKVPVSTRDEIGVVAQTFNVALDQLRSVEERNAAEREEAQRLQQNISEFLEVTMDIAEGDLTKRGRVSNDILGSVVDAINVAITEIASLLGQVQSVAAQVNIGSDTMAGTSDEVARRAQEQARQAQLVQEELVRVSTAIRAMAEQVQQTADAARSTLAASQTGQTAVRDTRQGLEQLRGEMQEISAGIQTLAARSDEITEVAGTISNFASQTALLALGASLEAVGAGEAGTRFMVVADSVRTLAEESAVAAQRVESIVKTVQHDIETLIERVQKGVRDANDGYRVATQAGQLLEQIEALASRSAGIAESISRVSREQAEQAARVTDNALVITTAAAQTEDQSVRSQQVARQLNQLAQQLNEQLSRFRLSS